MAEVDDIQELKRRLTLSERRTAELEATEQALRHSEARYRTLFETIDEGFVLIELLRDEGGRATDYRLIDCNRAFERQTGLTDAKGRLRSEVVPGNEDVWLAVYDEVARTGEAKHLENYHEPTGRWYDVYVSRVAGEEPTRLSIVFKDITDRKRAEAALKKSKERQAFLLELSDALRPITDATEVQAAAARLLAKHLGVERAYYVSVDEERQIATIASEHRRTDSPSIVGKHDMTLFGFAVDAYRAGKQVVVENIEKVVPPIDRSAYQAVSHIAFLGVPLIKGGELVCVMAVAHPVPHHWSDYEISAVEETAERTWEAVERARVEAALRESEEKFRSLFEAMDEAFALCKLERDANGRGIDYRYLELNPALERHGGMSPDALQGRLATEVFPNLDPWLVDTYTRVVDERQSLLVEHYFPHVDRWLRINAFPRGGDHFAVLYSDVTERQRTQAVLRESEERQAFLLELSDALRGLADPIAIEELVTRLLARQLKVSRAVYATFVVEGGREFVVIEREHRAPGTPSLVGRHPAEASKDDIDSLRAGRPTVIPDIETEPMSEERRSGWRALGARARMGVPLVKGGQLTVVLGVHDSRPRDWTPDDVALLAEVGERTWAAIERARAEAALRESEQNLYGVANVVPDLLWYSAPDGSTPWYNDRWLEYTGQTFEQAISWGWVDAIHPDDREGSARRYREAVEQSRPLQQEHRIRNAAGEYRWFLVRAEPLRDADRHVTRMYGAAIDIHDQRLAMEALRRSEERQAFLLRLSDALRPLSDPTQIQVVASRHLGEYLGVLRAGYGEIEGDALVVRADHTNGVPSMVGRYPIDAFGPALTKAYREGGLTVVRDAETDPDLTDAEREQFRAINVAAHVTVTICKAGQQALSLGVHSDAARDWTNDEISLIQDVAERTWAAVARARAEQAVREGEERFRLFVENVREYAFVQTDFEGVITSWNPGAERLFGYDSADVLGRPFVMLLPLEERHDGMIAREMAQLSQGKKVIDAHTVQRKNGSRFWAEWVTEPVLDDSGNLRGTAKVMRDETERQRGQRSLQESEQRLRIVLEGIPQLVWRSLEGGRWTWSSPQWQQFTGQTLEQSLDKGWLDVLHPDDRSRTMAAWHQAQSSGMLDVEHRIRRAADGVYVWHQTRSLPSSDAAEGAVEWLGTSTDIAAAKRANAEKEALLKEVHHRVKNNLQVITSLINLQSSQIGDEGVRSQFDETRNRIFSIASIHELLYRSESFADIDLIGYARQLTTDLVQFYGLGGRVRTEFTGEYVSIELERAVPYGLLVNELVSNALKHGFPGDRTGWVRVDVSQASTEVQLLISDDGVGILDGISLGKTHSLGMRLIVALTEQLGGTIDYLPGSGTAVDVRFPARPAQG